MMFLSPRIKALLLPAVFLILLVLAGCNSLSPVAELPEIVYQAADLTITLQPLDRDTLIDRHMSNRRRNQNPYLDYPGQIPKRRIVVFETTFETTESTVDFNLFEQNLRIESGTGRAQTALFMMQLWQGYTEPIGENLMRQTLNSTVLPKDFSVVPGKPVTGYLVFAAGYPKEGGRGMLTLSATTPDGDRGTFEIPVNFFGTDGAPSAVGENTGLFADTDSGSEE